MALLTSDDDCQQYLDKGIPVLQNIAKAFAEGNLAKSKG